MSTDRKFQPVNINPLKLKTVEDCDTIIVELAHAITRLEDKITYLHTRVSDAEIARLNSWLTEHMQKKTVMQARKKAMLLQAEVVKNKHIQVRNRSSALKESLLSAMAAAYRDSNEGIPLPLWYNRADQLITTIAIENGEAKETNK